MIDIIQEVSKLKQSCYTTRTNFYLVILFDTSSPKLTYESFT